MDALTDFLNSSNWYRAIPADCQALARSKARLKEVTAGDCLARTGEPSTHWYGVLSGVLQMYVVGADGGATTLFCLQQDEWGGDGSLLKNEPMQYELRALVSSLVCLIPKQTFDLLRQESIAFNQCLCDIMNRRMGAFVGMLAATRLLGPEMRVARAMTMVTRMQSGDIGELPVAQHELALLSGLSRQRVSQAIAELRKEGIVLSEPKYPKPRVDLARLQHYVTQAI